MAKRIAAGFLGFYQKFLSSRRGLLGRLFVTDSVCRFSPTCSEYSRQAIGRFGIWRGGWLTMRRLLRCHPWTVGGHDPVPDLK